VQTRDARFARLSREKKGHKGRRARTFHAFTNTPPAATTHAGVFDSSLHSDKLLVQTETMPYGRLEEGKNGRSVHNVPRISGAEDTRACTGKQTRVQLDQIGGKDRKGKSRKDLDKFGNEDGWYRKIEALSRCQTP
jgi:hypothetical protein